MADKNFSRNFNQGFNQQRMINPDKQYINQDASFQVTISKIENVMRESNTNLNEIFSKRRKDPNFDKMTQNFRDTIDETIKEIDVQLSCSSGGGSVSGGMGSGGRGPGSGGPDDTSFYEKIKAILNKIKKGITLANLRNLVNELFILLLEILEILDFKEEKLKKFAKCSLALFEAKESYKTNDNISNITEAVKFVLIAIGQDQYNEVIDIVNGLRTKDFGKILKSAIKLILTIISYYFGNFWIQVICLSAKTAIDDEIVNIFVVNSIAVLYYSKLD